MTLQKKPILCVNDHTDAGDLIPNILHKYEIVLAYSMAEALVQTTKKINLYLLDYHLPDGNGIELCHLIKNFDTETPILFVNGTSSMTQKQAATIGAQGLIRKGKESFVAELQKKVSEILAV